MKQVSEYAIESELFTTAQFDPDAGKILIEQYKLYVDSLEKLVARRQTSHSVFLTANAFMLTVAGLFIRGLERPMSPSSGIAILAVATSGILLSLTWRKLSRHYGCMSSAKFEVVHCLERHLPAAPFWAEWIALGEGKDQRKYQSMAKTESTIPMILAASYFALAIYAGISLAVR